MMDTVINMGIGIFLGVVVMAAMTSVALLLVGGLGDVGKAFIKKLGEKMDAIIGRMWENIGDNIGGGV